MRIQLSPKDFTAAITDVMRRAMERVDVACNSYLSFAGPASIEVAHVLDVISRGVRVRCQLGVEHRGDSINIEELKKVLSEVAAAPAAVQVKLSHEWVGSHYAVVDGRLALVASMPVDDSPFSRTWNVFLTDEPDVVREYAQLFEHSWEYGREVQGLLRSQTAERISSWDELITVSHVPWDTLLRELAKSHDTLYSLPPRKFEEVVAELLLRKGLEVQLTPTTNDGGRDILAVSRKHGVDLLYLVECKRYRLDRPVGVSLVRSLYGVVEQERATAGMMFTTSRFTRGAIVFQRQVHHRMALHDYESIVKWILSALDPLNNTTDPTLR